MKASSRILTKCDGTRALPTMIVKKHDRGIILNYIDRYKKGFGTVVAPLEPILEEIEHGMIADYGLILQDRLGKEIKWEARRQQWHGKIVYVDF